MEYAGLNPVPTISLEELMKIYITKGDQRAGPYNLAQINAFLNIGRLTMEDYAWYEGCLNWIQVKGIPGVRLLATQGKSSYKEPVQSRQISTPSPVTPPQMVRPKEVEKEPANETAPSRARISCRICESGTLNKTTLPRFAKSLNTLGVILLVLSITGMVLIFLATILGDPRHSHAAPVRLVIGGSQPIDPLKAEFSLMPLKKAVIDNWRLIFLMSSGGLLFFFLFQTKKEVLQCDYCNSIVAIE
jgi:hypothetical protein